MSAAVDVRMNDKQLQAINVLTDMSNEINEVLFGGGARGGKTFLGCLWQILARLKYPGSIGMICREQLYNLEDTTKKTFREVVALLGLKDYITIKGGSINTAFFANGSYIFFRSLAYRPKDPNFDRFGSYGISDLFIDEAQQVAEKAINVLRGRFSVLTGKNADGTTWQIKPKALYCCNPSKGWIYNQFWKPFRDGHMPYYRCFIRSLPQDNPYVTQDFINNLLHADKITIERLYYGNFDYDDDTSALCNYDAICDLFTNDFIRAEGPKSLSADIAGKGHDRFVVGVWTGNVCRIAIDKDYSPGKQVETDVKNTMIQERIARSLAVVDADGIGSFLESYLVGINEFHGGATPLDPRYQNLRAECYFKLAELINARALKIVCTDEQRERIMEELSIIRQKDIDKDTNKKNIIPKETMRVLLGRSPDYADMLMMAMFFRRKKQASSAPGTTLRVSRYNND